MNYLDSALSALLSDLSDVGATATRVERNARTASAIDAVVRVELDGQERLFVVECKRHIPRTSDLASLAQRLTPHGSPLLLCPRVEAALARELVRIGWSWADNQGNYVLQAPGMRLVRTGQARAEVRTAARLPSGLVGRRLLRRLISAWDERDPTPITELATHVGGSQAAVSQIIGRLRGLGFVGATRGLGEVDRPELLHEFVRQYPGVGGRVVHAYSLAAPTELADRITGELGPSVAVSADVGPDTLVPWRAPTSLIVYARDPIVLDRFDIVEAAGPTDANVIIYYPADSSVFVDYDHPKGHFESLADPTQMYIDLLRLGGDDRLEAAEKLEAWILK